MASSCKMFCEDLKVPYPVHCPSVYDVVSRCRTCMAWFDNTKYPHRCPCCKIILSVGPTNPNRED